MGEQICIPNFDANFHISNNLIMSQSNSSADTSQSSSGAPNVPVLEDDSSSEEITLRDIFTAMERMQAKLEAKLDEQMAHQKRDAELVCYFMIK